MPNPDAISAGGSGEYVTCRIRWVCTENTQSLLSLQRVYGTKLRKGKFRYAPSLPLKGIIT
jgi:hypothetical protein